MIDNSRRANLTASFLGLVLVLSIDAPSVRAQAAETFKGPAERQIQVMAEAGQVDAQLQMARLYLDGSKCSSGQDPCLLLVQHRSGQRIWRGCDRARQAREVSDASSDRSSGGDRS